MTHLACACRPPGPEAKSPREEKPQAEKVLGRRQGKTPPLKWNGLGGKLLNGKLLNGKLLNGKLLNGKLLNGKLLNGKLLQWRIPPEGLLRGRLF